MSENIMFSRNDNMYTIITGASEGLGKALAVECAAMGHNLVLVALPGSGLPGLTAFLRDRYMTGVLPLELDLSMEENRLLLLASVKAAGITPAILINNAGIGSTMTFEEGDFSHFRSQVQLNILSVVHLTHLFLPVMKDHTSYILNVSSLCTFFYPPRKQVYGATKSFIYFFSKSLRKELRGTNVSVSVLCPGGMNTNVTQYLSNRLLSPLAKISFLNTERVARIAMEGLLKRKDTIIPGRLNRTFCFLDRLLAQWLKDRLISGELNKIKPVIQPDRKTDVIRNVPAVA